MKWSDTAWLRAEPVYLKILELPFVKQLADGTLDNDRFEFYLRQDALYLDNYTRVLTHIASRLPRKGMIDDFLRFAADGIAVEKALHESYLGNIVLDAVEPTPTCLLYNSFERSCGLDAVEIEAASVLPCFWVYQKVGEHILANSSHDNPYRRWIETYGDPAFAESTARAIEICDALAADSTTLIRQRMTDTFVTATRMEWMFWHSAYNFEKWEI